LTWWVVFCRKLSGSRLIKVYVNCTGIYTDDLEMGNGNT
jgi:hypothetical protein